MSLLNLQRTMVRALMQPLTPAENMSRRAPNGEPMARYAARFIKPNDRLTSFERLELYNRQYWWRLLSCMADDFPGLQAILGNQRFEALSRAYLVDCPSTSFTLRNLGRRLEAWMKKHPQWAGSRQAVALDMVRLEWADIEAFDEPSEEPLRPAGIAKSAGPGLRLRLQPYVRLLSLQYPVDSLVLEIKRFNDDTQFLSNTLREHKQRKRVRAVARLKRKPIYLAVHRVDESVYFRRLDAAEFGLLTAIAQGKTLGQAVGIVFGQRSVHGTVDPAEITRCFQNWANLGWFCVPKGKSRKA